MNIVKSDIDAVNATITISIEKADYTEKVEKTLREYRKKANIPGFRPGMVPMGLIQKMYGKAVLGEEINKILSDGLYDYIRDNQLNILGEPLPNETIQKDIDFEQDETFEFVFDIAIAPEFDVTLTQKDKVKYYNITVTDEMINSRVDTYKARYGKYEQQEQVEEKDMIKGSIAELSEGKISQGGIHLVDATLTAAYMKDDAQKSLFIGAKKGDVIIFNPQTAFESEVEISSLLKISKEQAKNITSDFQLNIESITRYHEAEVNQELFDKVFGDDVVKSEQAFRDLIKQQVEANLKEDSEYKFSIDAKEVLLKKYDDLQFPDQFLKRWLLHSNEKMTDESLETEYPSMINALKWHLVIDKLATSNQIKVEPVDVEEYGKKMARAQFAQYGMIGIDEDIVNNYAKDLMKKEDTVKKIVEKVMEDKVLEYIKGAIKLDTKEISIENFNKLFEQQ